MTTIDRDHTVSIPIFAIIILIVLPSVVLPIAIVTSILLYKYSQKRKCAMRLKKIQEMQEQTEDQHEENGNFSVLEHILSCMLSSKNCFVAA